MRLIDMALVAGLFMAVGWISSGLWYARTPKTCPAMQGNVAIAMIVNTSGGYVCQYQPRMWGIVNSKVNRS